MKKQQHHHRKSFKWMTESDIFENSENHVTSEKTTEFNSASPFLSFWSSDIIRHFEVMTSYETV